MQLMVGFLTIARSLVTVGELQRPAGGCIMSDDFPTYAEIGEQNIRERYGPLGRLVDMGEQEAPCKP